MNVEARGHPFTNIEPDDADHLLFMVEQAHQPFRSPMISIGDIASEWVKRWRRIQPKVEQFVGNALNPANMRDALRTIRQSRAPGGNDNKAQKPQFSFEEAADILSATWPGIIIGEPERAWSKLPVIAELGRLRLAVRQSDPNQIAEGTARYRYSAPEIVR